MKYSSSEQAKRSAIAEYQGFCIISDVQQVVGCHIYPAGSCKELSCYSENIVPLHPDYHTNGHDTLDWEIFQDTPRKGLNRIIFLLDHVHGDYKPKFIRQLYQLVKIMATITRFEADAEEILILLGTYE